MELEILLTISIISVILVTLMLIASIRKPVHSDLVGNFTLVQVIITLFTYGISGILFASQRLSSVKSSYHYQLSGSFAMLSMLSVSITVAYRYMYYSWILILERSIISRRWILGSIVIWILLLTLTIVPTYLGWFEPREPMLQSMIPFYHKGTGRLIYSLAVLFMLLSGGLAHFSFNLLILRKIHTANLMIPSKVSDLPRIPRLRDLQYDTSSSTSLTLHQNSDQHLMLVPITPTYPSTSPPITTTPAPPSSQMIETSAYTRAILKKFLPVFISYFITHLLPISLLIYEIVNQTPTSITHQKVYSGFYLFTCLLSPLATIGANPSLINGILP